MNYYVGNFKSDSTNDPNNGWLVGSFKEYGPRKTNDVEIKYWEYKKGENVKSYLKVSSIIECTFILKGSTKCLIDDDEIILNQGDYIVINPGVKNNTVSEILDDVQGLTIKAPSDTSAKTII